MAQYIDTLTNWLVELKNDAIVLNAIDKADIALMHKTNDAIRIMNNVTLNEYASFGSSSFPTWLQLSSEMENLGYQLRVNYSRSGFDSSVARISSYLNEFKKGGALPDHIAESHLSMAEYYYNTAKQEVNNALCEAERCNAAAKVFFTRMRSIESEMLHRLNAKKDEDFPPLSAPVRR
jgi:hypothetical protein